MQEASSILFKKTRKSLVDCPDKCKFNMDEYPRQICSFSKKELLPPQQNSGTDGALLPAQMEITENCQSL